MLGALETLQRFRPDPGDSVSLADLRERLLQMPAAQLDRVLLELERRGSVELHGNGASTATRRERRAAISDLDRGLLVFARRARAKRTTRRKEVHHGRDRILVLNVRVPEPLLEALDRYVSSAGSAPSAIKMSRAAVARELLERVLERKADDRLLASLRSSILSAVAAEARRTGVATLSDLRQRLAEIPQAELDRALLALEARGALVLVKRPEGAPETERDVKSAVWCSGRGPLSLVRLPVPRHRLDERAAVRKERKRRFKRTG